MKGMDNESDHVVRTVIRPVSADHPNPIGSLKRTLRPPCRPDWVGTVAFRVLCRPNWVAKAHPAPSIGSAQHHFVCSADPIGPLKRTLRPPCRPNWVGTNHFVCSADPTGSLNQIIVKRSTNPKCAARMLLKVFLPLAGRMSPYDCRQRNKPTRISEGRTETEVSTHTNTEVDIERKRN